MQKLSIRRDFGLDMIMKWKRLENYKLDIRGV
jgi:hypothetical protein